MKKCDCPITDIELVERIINAPRSSLSSRMRSLQTYAKSRKLTDAWRGEIYRHFYRPARRAA